MLPPVLSWRTNIFNYELDEAIPNFVTSKVISSEIVVIKGGQSLFSDVIRNRIVVTEAADPGYDWIFTYPIAGLVTKYGGAASHMAIRCHELGIPAAIGCGKIIYDDIVGARVICIDAEKEPTHGDDGRVDEGRFLGFVHGGEGCEPRSGSPSGARRWRARCASRRALPRKLVGTEPQSDDVPCLSADSTA